MELYTEWQECIKDAIDSIPLVRYKTEQDSPRATGVTRNVYFNNVLVLPTNSDESISICSGVQYQAFVEAADKHSVLSVILSARDIKNLKKWAYVHEGPPGNKKIYADGLPGGLIELGIAEKIHDPMKAQYGDICQIHGIKFNNAYDDGHAVIIERVSYRRNKPVLWCWSSSPATGGVGRDWFWINKERNGIERKFSIARIIE
jgi:hypothetical protein